jgi:tetratricopeptide (TPR) repeat protein
MIRMLILSVCLLAATATAWPASKAVADAQKLAKDGKFDEAIALLESDLKKNPKSDETKTALAAVHYENGEKVMYDKALPPFQKYPAALKSFRKTLEYDPKHRKAQDHINTIESIYKSMGRPVPK